MKFFTSDTHFFHERIIELCERPFNNIHHMNAQIVNNWNRVVQEDDIVYHLGDVMLGQNFEGNVSYLNNLKGYKILVVGNHDRMFGKMSDAKRERWMDVYGNYFNEIHEHITGLELSNGSIVNLSHFPYDGDSHGDDRYVNARLPDDGIPLIHGHTHGNNVVSRSNAGSLQVHVGVDAWAFGLVEEDMVEWIVERHS